VAEIAGTAYDPCDISPLSQFAVLEVDPESLAIVIIDARLRCERVELRVTGIRWSQEGARVSAERPAAVDEAVEAPDLLPESKAVRAGTRGVAGYNDS
jgi:hypothetical protein